MHRSIDVIWTCLFSLMMAKSSRVGGSSGRIPMSDKADLRGDNI